MAAKEENPSIGSIEAEEAVAGVAMVENEGQAISDTGVAAASQKWTPGACFSEDEDAGHEYSGWSTDEEEEDDRDDDAILSKAEFQLALDRINAKYNRFIERLRARNKTLRTKDYTAADFLDSDDEEVVRDNA
jgi:hypothetical protein